MRITKYVLALVFSLGLAIPSFAVELSLGGFPSFMRFRWRTYTNATAHSVTNRGTVTNLAASDGETIHFADMTLRLTPQLVLSDNVTIRASVDVLSNAVAGGATPGLFGATTNNAGGVVMSDISTSDRFNGTLLYGTDAIDEDHGEFKVKYLMADINLGEYGFLRVGRQPFDFGLGIYANGGHNPYDDQGFQLDRVLWLKGYDTALGATTLVLVSDYIGGGGNNNDATTDEPLSAFEGNGQTVDYLAAALIVANGQSVYGVYYFPKIRQKNLGGAAAESNLDMNFTLYEAYYTYTGDDVFFGLDWAGGFGTLKPESSSGKADTLNVDKSNYVFVAQLRFNNLGGAISDVGFEYGRSPGDEYTSGTNDYQGAVIRGNSSYEVDNLLFKHVIPSLYGLEGSIINAEYFKVDANMPMGANSNMNLKVVMAWAEQTNDQQFAGDITGGTATIQDIGGYWGTVYEAIYSHNLVDGVELSLIGTYIDAGNGLKDAMSDAADGTAVRADADGSIYGFQTRLLIFIDDFFKAPAASK